MIFDVTTVIFLGCYELCLYKMVSLLDKYVCSNCSTDQQFPFLLPLILLPLVGPPYSLRHNNIEIRPINNCTMASEYSSERKTYMTLTLNQS